MEICQITPKSASPNKQYKHQDSMINNCDITLRKQLVQQQKHRDEEKINNLKDSIPDINNIFEIHNRIGSGTFSTVFLASLKNEQVASGETAAEKRKLFAIKQIIPTSSPQRIVKELKCLIDIGGVDNVIGIRLCLRCNENVAFAMPYIQHDKFQSYFEEMSVSEVQLYMRNLLIALRRVHKFGIIHRDVKPSNFLYNRRAREFLLIDFGLAQSVVTRSDREMSLLKRKKIDAKSPSSELGYGIMGNNSKKLRIDRPESEQQRSPDKMPLKPFNGVSGITSIGTATAAGAAACSEQSNKNSKSESPKNLNTQFEKISADNSKLKSNMANNKYSRTIVTDVRHQQQSNSTYAMNSSSPNSQQNKCNCYGKPQVCKVCLVRREIPASRAGTPGYRPPEVLLKYTDQTTAVDVWAAGVILISILSGVYPFFKAPDDFIALAEIVLLFGDESIRKTAFSLGRQVVMSRKCKPLNLRRLCVRLRNRNNINRSELLEKYEKNGKTYEECSNCQQMSYDCLCENTKHKLEDVGEDPFPKSAYDFLAKLLEINPHKRVSAAKALQHPFMREKFD